MPEDPTPSTLVADRPWLGWRQGGLCLEGVALDRIAAAGTPAWVYGAETIRQRHRRLADALGRAGLAARIHFAVKANSHLAILRLLARAGAGADVVSGGELRRALAAGIAPGAILFSGVGKTEAELALAVETGIHQINVESAAELAMLSAVAQARGRTAQVAFRVNPDVDAGTHAKITTGRADNKFGIAWPEIPALYAHAASLPGIAPVGLAVHIGSQIADMAPYEAAYRRMASLADQLIAAGHRVARIDCGGGLGIRYGREAEACPDAYAATLAACFGGRDLALAVEPGRWLVGPAGLLLTRVVLNKRQGEKRFMVLDAAMNDLARPALYQAWHGLVPLRRQAAEAACVPQDVVGPVCETGDNFAEDRDLPLLEAGEPLALLDAGAYGAVMSSTYNSRTLAAEIMVDGENGQCHVIRPRQTEADLWRDETVPPWLA